MPDRPKTPIRSVRCHPERWEAARANLALTGTDISSAIRGFVAVVADADPGRVAEVLERFPPRAAE